jgi:alpha-galactosidase
MPTAIKISVIGAGSASFSMGLVRDLCLTDSLEGSCVSFWDVDSERLDTIDALARRFAREVGAKIEFEKAASQAASLEDADFVINTALAGGHGLEESERSLLEKNGYYRGVRLLDSFHQFDLMSRIARDMEKICPKAWLLQVSNPVFEGTTLVTRETSIKAIGLCHGHYGYQEIASVIGLDPDEVTFEAVGFNHCIWMTSFRYRGKDAYPLLDRWIAEESENYWKTHVPQFYEAQMSPAAIQLYHFYGLMPIGDTARAHWPEVWWFNTDFETKKHWYGALGGFDSTQGWTLYLEDLKENIQTIQQVAGDPKLPVTSIFKPEKSDEQIVPIMDALINDRQGYFQVNIPNQGALPGIPSNIAVEVPALVDGKGVRPLRVEPLPEKIMLGVLWPRWIWAERALAAYQTGDRDFLIQMLLADHRTLSWQHAEETLEKFLGMSENVQLANHFKNSSRK